MFQENVSLKKYSNYKIGGRARYFYAAKNADDVARAVAQAAGDKLPVFILGAGTNLLINDSGFDGLVLKPEINLLKLEGGAIRVGAGVLMEDLLNFAVSKGLSGFEWAGGLPGTVGGAIRGNAGAFGGETKDNLYEVTSMDISGNPPAGGPKILKRKNTQCKFGYRNSIFKINDGQEVIIEAVFKMKKGDKKAIRAAIEEKKEYRRTRQPLEYPNIGSIFKNVDLKRVPEKYKKAFASVVKKDPFPVMPVAHLIDQAGLKGVSCGGAMISPKHPNFIVNTLNASSSDVKQLIQLAKSTIKQRFDLELEEEVIYV
ncbi:MAG: UDP-N-acetylenolpyruvoylglucosamine reductase [Parcubacteria group bacterium GW2011_GWA1_48_11b]|nr:MAG: UDP-N-acetylenolpyruvoylglucosamine reductase [Parcubacteria group bacterium GW2011_GWA1_48_11b]